MGLNPKFKRNVQAKRRAATMSEPVSSPKPTPEPSTDDPLQRRVDLAQRWLGGYAVKGKNGLLKRVYPTGDEERECRSAMARLLWEAEVHPELLWLLAMYIAPDGHELADGDHRLKLVRRRRGNKTNPSAALQIAFFVREGIRSGLSSQQAFDAAAGRYGVTSRHVMSCWAYHKGAFEALDETPPAQ